MDVLAITIWASLFVATCVWRGALPVTVIRTSGDWPSLVRAPDTAREVTWPRSFPTGMPA